MALGEYSANVDKTMSLCMLMCLSVCSANGDRLLRTKTKIVGTECTNMQVM